MKRILGTLITLGAFAVVPAAAEDLMSQTEEQVARKNANCMSCHTETDSATMHESDIPVACVDCHGGDPNATEMELAHVLPTMPELFETSANPERSGAQILFESPEFVRFINPGDLRVAHESCGLSGCHEDILARVQKSMMTHGGSLWAAALYNNGAFPEKDARFGEAYTRDGRPARLAREEAPTAEETRDKGILPFLDPLARWEVTQPGNVLRVFERGGKKPLEIGTTPQKVFLDALEPDPNGRPEKRLSHRGFGTLNRTDPVFIGLQKTRLLDPLLPFLGTNDQPGDYRSSGCTSCHTIYANDRNPVHSGSFAQYGNRGKSATADPTIPLDEPGHPIQHVFTTGIPSSQCMVCHLHPGTNMLMSYYGTTWWDNETDGDLMYPEESRELSAEERVYEIEARNPEGAALRGKWSDPEFLAETASLNPKMKRTQFADFHGHGWMFRNVYKQDLEGNLLDARGSEISWDDPEKFRKAVHLMDIHLEKGMHCVDCHFEQDVHGNGELYGEVRNAIEIQCGDCHGSIYERADPTDRNWKTSGPAGGNPLKKYNRTKFGPRFFEKDGKLWQRSAVTVDLEWELVQTMDTVDPFSDDYNEASRWAKTVRKDGTTWGNAPEAMDQLAHADDRMTCFACHSSWMTSCFGCHLPQQANRRTPMLHNEGETLRNWTSYNYQVVRDDVFMLGIDGSVAGGRISPVRSSSAVVVGSQNQNREWIYVQQQTVSAEGFAGQAFNTHVPHTVRSAETKVCTDCHVSDENDNNALMAQLLTLGTQFTNFLGRFVYVGIGDGGLEAVAVTERDEPQAVIGSTLHDYAYPERYQSHEANGRVLDEAHHHPGNDILDLAWLFGRGDEVQDLLLRGEYLYAANGPGGLRVYDVAFIDHKGFSERIVTAPVSPLGQRLYVRTAYATSVEAPTTLAVDPTRSRMPENEEQPIHPLYGYLYVTDLEEGLILVGVATLLDGNPANNFLERALTFNPDGVLDGARRVRVIGTYAYVLCDRGLVVVDIDDPMAPRVVAEVGGLVEPRAIDHQFRYAFVVDRTGLHTIDVTKLEAPRLVEGSHLPLGQARDLYVARTRAYVAAGKEGLVIVDVTNPERPELERQWDAGGAIDDAHAVVVGMTNASAFAYVADGENGLRVVQLTSPEWTDGHFGFSPNPVPRLIATYPTHQPAIALSKGLDRDRAVDESGNQVAVFGRRGGRPLNGEEMRRLYMRNGEIYQVTDFPPDHAKEVAFREAPPEPAPAPRPAPREVPGVKLREERPGVELRPGVRLREPE